MTDSRSDLIAHLRANALRTDGPFTLSSGEAASWYLDARQTTFSGEGAAIVGAAVLAVLDPRVAAVGGMTMGADPVAMATAIASGGRLDAFSIRKQAKTHGTGGRLVGPVPPGTPVAVLEDTTSTGGAFFDAIDAVVAEELEVVQAITLVDRSGATVRHKMADLGIPFLALVTPGDLGVADV